MTNKKLLVFGSSLKLAALCIIAAVLNHIIHPLLVPVLRLPLFVDTVFTAAVTFYAGLIPGLVTAFLTWIIGFTIKNGNIHPFIICSVAEVIIIFLLKPAEVDTRKLSAEKKRTAFIIIWGKLMVLYIIVCVSISILGGLIDYIFYTVLPNTKADFSAEDAFKEWYLQSAVTVLPMSILSRLPVNIVDRLIVIFGGYFISRILFKYIKKGD